MKIFFISLTLLTASQAFAAKSYQVTGPITAVTATSITVQKGKESWELSKDASTTGPTDLKVGDKVTVYYSMSAQKIEAKEAKPSKAKKK